MLRQFHYIDQNGKDQGVNVRNRAQEIAKLLSDVDAIRAERKKARANRNKAGGVEGGMVVGGGMSSGSRYGGFGSEGGFGGYRGEVYGDGGGFGGNTSGFSDTQRRSDKFEEYDEDVEDGGSSSAKVPSAKIPTGLHARTSSGLRAASLNTIKREAKIKREPEQDLFDFGDEPAASSTLNGKATTSSPKSVDEFGAMESGTAAEDDFDDFQSATTPGLVTEAQRKAFSGLTSPAPVTSTFPSSASTAAVHSPSNLHALFASIHPSSDKPTNIPAPSMPMTSSIFSPPSYSQATHQTTGHASTGPNYYTSVQSTINQPSTTPSFKSPISSTILPSPSFPGPNQKQSTPTPNSSTPKPSSTTSSTDAFTSLWSTASAKSGIPTNPSGRANSNNNKSGPDLASLAKAKNEAAMWGTPAQPKPPAAGVGMLASTPLRPSAPALTPATRTVGQQQQQQQQPQSSQMMGGGLDDLLA
jgi:epsin